LPLLLCLLSAISASGCKDNYANPIVDPAASQHHGSQLLGTWRVVTLNGEPSESETSLSLESDQAGLLRLRFHSTPTASQVCAVQQDGDGYLISVRWDVSEAQAAYWGLARAQIASSGERLEVYVPKFEVLKAAVLSTRLQGEIDSWVEGDQYLQIDESSSGLRAFFSNSAAAFGPSPSVVLERASREATLEE
jgi:hypothetical protein